MLLTCEKIYPDGEAEEMEFQCDTKEEALEVIEYEVTNSCSPLSNPEGWSLANFVLHNDDGTEENLSSYAKQFVVDY